MSRKSGHFHSNLGCEAAGDSLPSNSCRFLPSPPPQLCYLLHAPAPTPSRTHPLRHSGFSLHPPSQSTRPHKLHLAGMKEREQHHTGIIRSYTGGHHLLLEGASIARGWRQVQCPLCNQRTEVGSEDCAWSFSQDSRSHSCTSKNCIFHVSK